MFEPFPQSVAVPLLFHNKSDLFAIPYINIYIRWTELERWSLQRGWFRDIAGFHVPGFHANFGHIVPDVRGVVPSCAKEALSLSLAVFRFGTKRLVHAVLVSACSISRVNRSQSTWFQTGHEQRAPWPRETSSQATSGTASSLLLI